jgi:hypothetical protein
MCSCIYTTKQNSHKLYYINTTTTCIEPKDDTSRFSSSRKAAQLAIMQSLHLPKLMPENAPLSAVIRSLNAAELPSGVATTERQRKLYRYLTHFIQNVASQFIFL